MTLGELADMLQELGKAVTALNTHNTNVRQRYANRTPSRVEEAQDREREIILMNVIDDLRKQEIDPL